MAQKNKQTQTTKPEDEHIPYVHQYGYGVVPSHMMCQYYMDREKELYKQACRIKGIPVNSDVISEPEQPQKAVYRYTLEEMKSYNPYRHYYY